MHYMIPLTILDAVEMCVLGNPRDPPSRKVALPGKS